MRKTYQGRTPTSERRDSQNESPMRIVPSKSVHRNSAIVPVSLGGDVVLLTLDCVTLDLALRHPEFHTISVWYFCCSTDPLRYYGALTVDQQIVPAALGEFARFRSTGPRSNIP